MKAFAITVLFFLIAFCHLHAQSGGAHMDSVRTLVAGIHRVSANEPAGVTVPLSYTSSSVIVIDGDARFFRGLQLELTSPHNFLAHSGSIALALYGDLSSTPGVGVADVKSRRLAETIVPARIRAIYQIPLRADHGLRTTPYATVLTEILDSSSFPLLFRLMPVSKGIPGELQNMVFNLTVRPIFSNEGALRLNIHYPENLPGRPFTLLINDEVMNDHSEEMILREGEHHLVILSEDYRNQSTRFVVERARTLELTVVLQDTSPLIVFEHPRDARVYLNNVFLPNSRSPQSVDPGMHEVRFHISDYVVVRTITVQRGRTYRVAMSVDMLVSEID